MLISLFQTFHAVLKGNLPVYKPCQEEAIVRLYSHFRKVAVVHSIVAMTDGLAALSIELLLTLTIKENEFHFETVDTNPCSEVLLDITY